MQGLNLELSKEELKKIKDSADVLICALEKELKSKKIKADVFVGGSFAKGTLIKGNEYDIDVFVRFDLKYNDLSEILIPIVESVGKKLGRKSLIVHGSRDYGQISDGSITFEIIPVFKIKKQSEARNVTDLSYFHVNYIKKKLKDKKLVREILLAKAFCKANGFYGAESYIGGFSGYALECLILHYKSFDKMLKGLANIIEGDRVVIDIEKKYKTGKNVFIEMNESKLKSPVVLIDPTWKERNALAGLSFDTFRKFQGAAKAFLKKPSNEFFEQKKFDEIDINRYAENKKAELVKVKLETDRQAGDIAGTKMKKFACFLKDEIEKFFDVLKMEFCYSGNAQKASAYYVLRSKGEIIREGPPLEIEEACKAFIEINKDNVFEKKGKLYACEKINITGKEFLKKWIDKNKEKIKGMGITDMIVV